MMRMWYMGKANNLIAAVVMILGVTTASGVQAITNNSGTGFSTASKHGVVMARSVVLNEQGQPTLVEYLEDGSEGAEVPVPSEYRDNIKALQIISAAEYAYQLARLADYRNEHANDLAKGADLMSRAQFLGQSFPLADNKSSVTPRESDLHSSVKSVLARGQSNRLIADSKQLALLTFTVDLTQNFNPAGYRSLVLNPQGQVIASSQHNIAPRAGFFGNPDERQSSSGRKPVDKIFCPVANTKVYVNEWVYPGGVDVTDENGRYNLKFNLPPCPGFSFEYATDVWADLTYQNFNPMGTSTLPFYLRRQDWDFCSGYLASVPTNSLAGAMAYVSMVGIYASAAIPIYNVDLTV